MKKFFAFFFVMMAACLLFSCKNVDVISEEATIIFEGAGTLTITSDGGNYEIPEYPLAAGQTLLGWALKADSKTPLVVDEVTYSDISDFIADKTLHLYPVLESKINLTMHGITDISTSLSSSSLNQATLPLVYQNDRQQFLGWAKEENAKEPIIEAGVAITYDTVKDLTNTTTLDLYPVIESYDLMICVHGSHSNGNVYISAEQRALLKEEIDKYFAEDNIKILIDYVDAVSAKNFADEAVKKDYDILLTSKSARNSGNEPGDIATAAIAVGKTYYAEADSNETVLACIELNQSRQVCRMLGGNKVKSYQEKAYRFFTTPLDYTVEITFKNGDLEETVLVHRVVDGAISNESYVPTNENIMKHGNDVFDGWTTVAGGTEVEFANASYANVYDIAVDGKITIYPVFIKGADAHFVVWGINGNNEYVSEEQFETMKSLFNAYCAANNISLEGKLIEFEYFEGKTADFQSKLTLEYVLAAVGAAALSNDTYAAYWTIDADHYASVVNVQCTNASRYCALRAGAADNEFALAFFNALCEAEISVKFAYNGVLSDAQIVSSTANNVAELPDSITAPAGQVLVGYALSADATEASITGSINYQAVASFAVDGAITLYPVFAAYDLVVYVWAGQSKTGTTYVTEAEVEGLKEDFIEMLGKAADGKQIVFYAVWGKTAEYGAKVGSDADVIISGPNLNSDAQCGALLQAGYDKIEVINYSFASGSTRYAGICKKAVSNDLAIELVEFLCDGTLTVTFDGEQPQQLNRVFGNTELIMPTVEVPSGKSLVGFATTENAEAAEVAVEGIKFDDLAPLATNGAITLYPVFAEAGEKIFVTVAYHAAGSSSSTIYFSEDMLTALQTMLATKLEEEGYDSDDYEITYKAYSGKVAAVATAIKNDGGADVCIAHTQVFDKSKATDAFVCAAAYPATQFSTKDAGHTFTCDSNLKVGVSEDAASNPIAAMIYSLLVNYTE